MHHLKAGTTNDKGPEVTRIGSFLFGVRKVLPQRSRGAKAPKYQNTSFPIGRYQDEVLPSP